MRAPLLALLGAGLGLAILLRRPTAPTSRGDLADDRLPLDNEAPAGDFVGPPWLDEEWPMDEPESPVYDPRDVLSRRYSPSHLKPSQRLIDWLRLKEKLVLNKYRLGDGGVTIGYGHFEPESRANLVPDEVTAEWAEATFASDLEARGARWVRQYVAVPLSQNEFDALTSLAFNLSPYSFNRIAQVLNAGGDWREIARQFVRPDLPDLTRGLQARREHEIAMFDQGVYS